MLRKLLKHEFRATGRIMLPLYVMLLLTAIGANISTRSFLNADNDFLNALGAALVIAFTVAIIFVCGMSFVLMIQRFHKNLLGDEGYVMMTLPASVHQQVWSKLIVSAVWFAATLLAVFLAAFIMVYEVGFMQRLLWDVRELFQYLTAYYALNGTALIAEFLLLCFVACFAMCLQFYAAMSVGYSFPNHKGLLSVVCFFGSQFVLQMLGTFLIVFVDGSPFYHWLVNWDLNLSGMAATHIMMFILIAGNVLCGAIFYVVTTQFLKKRLNLE